MIAPRRIAVIGGGIGGLTAALSLLRAEFEVDVYEQAPELNEVGGGINMAPNAVRVLHRLGLAERPDREGVRPRFTHQRRWWDGRALQRAPLNPLCEELYGAPHMTIHRADLLAVIASGFPGERLHLGHRLVALSAPGSPRQRTSRVSRRDQHGLLIDREHYKELAWQVREVARQAWFPFARKELLRLAASFEYRARNLGRY